MSTQSKDEDVDARYLHVHPFEFLFISATLVKCLSLECNDCSILLRHTGLSKNVIASHGSSNDNPVMQLSYLHNSLVCFMHLTSNNLTTPCNDPDITYLPSSLPI